MTPSVSVITPTKNRLKLLCEAMDSVQRQTFAAWEHIVIDDGSSDGTAEEVTRRAESDTRIRYMQRTGEKKGANVCRNIGIKESRAGLIVFLDSDDLLRPQCLEHRIEIMRTNPSLDFAVFRAAVFSKVIGDRNRFYHQQDPGDDLLRFLTHECVWEISGPIWRRTLLERIGCFDESLLSMQDLELHVRALSMRAKYLCFPNVDHDIRWQEDPTKTSVRHYFDGEFIQASERVQTKLLDVLTANGLLTWSRKRALLGLSFEAAECWARSKHFGRAASAWSRGCSRQGTRVHLHIAGLLMLLATRLGETPSGVCLRLVNKWKGWVRFRQEPSLLFPAKRNSSEPVTAEEASDCPA